MPFVQKITPNLNVTTAPGLCLEFVERTFNTPEPFDSQFATARDSWDASGFKHETNELPDAAVPVYFSWVGTIDGVTKDWGDCRLYVPGRGVFGSPLNWTDPVGNAWVADLNEIERILGAKYLGWTEDISGYRVVDYVDAPTPPAPTPTPEPAPSTNTVTVVEGDTLWDLSATHLGDPTRWPEIYELNKDVIGADPGLIHPGQTFVLPA